MNIKILTLALGMLCTIFLTKCMESHSESQKTSSTDLVENLLSKMTLEEKVGQMTQVTIDLILKDGSSTEIDPKKLENAIVHKHVGSILNVSGGAYDLNTWHHVIKTIQDKALETTNKIPVIYGIDAIHGASYTKNSTLFPHNIGLAATRNLELAKKMAHITAMETRASGIRWNFDPMLGVAKQPLWSRFEESFGEDSYLTTQFGTTIIKAYEGDDLTNIANVASCAKHYIGYPAALSGKDRTPAYIPERQLRQFYLPPFEEAVKAGTSTIMVNSSEINGIPVHADKYLLQDVLRDELGFDGVIVTDWEDIIRLHIRDRVAETPKKAVKIGIEAGIDMSMVPMDFSFYDLLVELVKEGEISEERINESVRRILKLKQKLGLFEQPYVEQEAISQFGHEDYSQVALQSARESITLLKNKNSILPLSKKAKILIAGPTGNNVSSMHSSWSYTWQGDNEDMYPSTTKTIEEAIKDIIGERNVLSISQKDFNAPENTSIQNMVAKAEGADAIVLCLGEKAYAESPGVIDDLTLDRNQLDLAKAAIHLGKPVVLVLLEGRPRVISEIEPHINGILLGYRPGSMGAQAIAETLFGDNNPSGRLSFTYPKFTGDLVNYDHKLSEEFTEHTPGNIQTNGYDPQWSFGHGLSYGEFSYKNLELSDSKLTSDETITATIEVENVGLNDGHVSVEMYCRDLFASVSPPVKQLKGFQKIFLKSGEHTTLSFEISHTGLYIINQQNQRVVEEGDFEITIGEEKATFTYSE